MPDFRSSRSSAIVALILLLTCALPGNEARADPLIDFWMARFGALMGDVDSQVALGEMYRKGVPGIRANFVEAEYWLQKAANQGSQEAQNQLALLFEQGAGVRKIGKNPVHAYAHYNLLALNGDMTAAAKRDLIGRNLKPGQIQEAQELTRQWMNNQVEKSE
ncbi:MAG: hypothetical protein H7834_11910 [Magnetococcus sp. YQC-9]